ncbi:MAG: hypothetical protein ABSC19_11355 [Syntrophorhabdales bacterium]|jgi:hypothetical protein
MATEEAKKPVPAQGAEATKMSPLEGRTSVDDKMVFEAEWLSYGSAGRLAMTIADAVQGDVTGKTVVIAGAAFLTDMANLQAILVRLEELQNAYKALGEYADEMAQARQEHVEEGEKIRKMEIVPFMAGVGLTGGAAALMGAVGTVAAGVSAALGLASLFREDVNYAGIQTVVNQLAFELALASRVKASGASAVFVPDLVALPSVQNKPDSIRGRLQAVQEARMNVWKTVGPFISELVRLDAELDSAAKEKKQDVVNQLSMKLAGLRQDLDPVTEPLKQLDQRLSDLQTAWDKTDETSGLTLLARLLRAEGIKALNPRYLHALVVSSGGYSRTTRSLWRTMFSGDGLSFTGGTVVRWALLEENGSVAKGGIESDRASEKFPLPQSGVYGGKGSRPGASPQGNDKQKGEGEKEQLEGKARKNNGKEAEKEQRKGK